MLAVYPHSATELSADHFQKAYKDEVPEPRQLEGLQNLAMNHAPLRNTSHLLSKQNKAKENLPSSSTARPQDTVECATSKEPFQDFQHHVKTWNNNMAALLATVAKPTPPIEVKTSSNAAETQAASVQPAEKTAATPLPLADEHKMDPAAKNPKDLEEYEREAFEKLTAAKCSVQKKPAARNTKASKGVSKGGQGEKGAKGNKATKNHQCKKIDNHTFAGKLGCIRCRGNQNGCDTSKIPNFQGLRLPGRQAWLKWSQARARKQG